MSRLTLFVVLLLLSGFYHNPALAERYTMHQIEQLPAILDKATPDTLVIFDVDEVLIYPKNLIQLQPASPFWEASMADIESRLGKAARDLLHSIMLLQSAWELTDPALPDLIRNLQKKKILVLALTSFRRGQMGNIQSVEDWRNLQLKKHNMDFSLYTGLTTNNFEVNKLKNPNLTKRPVYKDGIIYTDLHTKSDVLHAFLTETKLNPKEIIFIDDRLSNIVDLENFCINANINFIGIHDARIMKKYPDFDQAIGKFQFEHLENYFTWLSDEDAKREMANTEKVTADDKAN